jgi:Regulatory CLIP domain of proteinases
LIFYFVFNLVLDICATPDNESGTCISIKECPLILGIVKSKSISNQQLQYLKKSQCGFIDNTVHVCCPATKAVTDDQQRPTDALSLLPDIGTCGEWTTDRIFGGEQTKVDEFPWMALIQYSNGRCRGARGIFHTLFS